MYGGDVQRNVACLRLHNYAAGFLVQMRVKAAQPVGKLARWPVRFTRNDNIPVFRGFSQQYVAQRAAYKVGLLLPGCEVLRGLL